MFQKKNNNNTINIVKDRLSVLEYYQFISCVSDAVVINNNLHLENFKPVFYITCLDMFTDVPLIKRKTNEDNNEEIIDFDATYKFCIDNNVMDMIIAKVGKDYINQLYEDCKETIEFKKEKAIAMTSPFSDILNELKELVNKIDISKYDDIVEFAKNVNKFNLNKNDFINGIVRNISSKNKVDNKEKTNE